MASKVIKLQNDTHTLLPVTDSKYVQYYNGTSYESVATALNNKKYAANISLSSNANYITEPEFKTVKINGSNTNDASTENCILEYDTTNKCLNFVFN